MHEKDSEDSVHKMHEGWEMEDRRGRRGGGFGQNSRFLNEFPQRKLGLESVNNADFPEDFSKTPVKARLVVVCLPPAASSERAFSWEIWGFCAAKREVR